MGVSTVIAVVAVCLAEFKPTKPKLLKIEDKIKPYNTGPVTFNVEISNAESDVNTKSDSTKEEERDEPAPRSSRGVVVPNCECPDCSGCVTNDFGCDYGVCRRVTCVKGVCKWIRHTCTGDICTHN